MNSKIKALREYIRAEIKKALNEDAAPVTNDKLKSLYKQLNTLNLKLKELEGKENKAATDTIKKNLPTQGSTKDLATQSTQDKKAKENAVKQLNVLIAKVKKDIAAETAKVTSQNAQTTA